MRSGVDRTTGKVLTGWGHCAQSIGTILSTAIGSLLMARDFGSDVPALVDRPASAATLVDFYMAVATALKKEEPGFRLTRVTLTSLGADGQASVQIEGTFYPNTLEGDFGLGIPVNENIPASVAGLQALAARSAA